MDTVAICQYAGLLSNGDSPEPHQTEQDVQSNDGTVIKKCILPFPADSTFEAMLTVVPNRQYLGIFIPTTPATTGPEITMVQCKRYMYSKNF